MKKRKRLLQTVIECGTTFWCAGEMLLPAHTSFTPTDYQFMVAITHRSSSCQLTAGWSHLMTILISLNTFYKSVNLVIVNLVCPDTSYKPGVHKFFDDFVKHYLMDNGFVGSLVSTMAYTYVPRRNDVSTSPYSAKVLNLSMALSAS